MNRCFVTMTYLVLKKNANKHVFIERNLLYKKMT